MRVIFFLVFSVMWQGCVKPATRSGLSDMSAEQEVPSANASDDSSYYNGAVSEVTSSPAETAGEKKSENWSQPKKKVLVFDFWNSTPIDVPGVGQLAADDLRKMLTESGKVVSVSDMRTFPHTKDFVQGDRVKVAQLVREGRRQGVAAVVIGRISKIIFRQKQDDIGILRRARAFASIEVEVKVFDLSAGREINSFTHVGELEDSKFVSLSAKGELSKEENQEIRNDMVTDAVHSVMDRFPLAVIQTVEKLSWEGRVAKITGKKIYINAGRSSGLMAGDILRVMTVGDEIYDPTTGAFLGSTPGQMKGTLEVVDFVNEDASVASIHSGGGFQEGDIIRLY